VLAKGYSVGIANPTGFHVCLVEECVQFLEENFDVDDVNALSDKAYRELYEELAGIECDPAEYSEDGDYSYRGQLASAIITEMGASFRAHRQLPHDSVMPDDTQL